MKLNINGYLECSEISAYDFKSAILSQGVAPELLESALKVMFEKQLKESIDETITDAKITKVEIIN